MKIIVLGCGNIGFVAARDLSENLPSAEIMLADIDETRAKQAASRIYRSNVSWIKADASKYTELVKTLKKTDLAVGALPGEIGYLVAKGAVDAGVDLVDVSYMPEDVMTLHEAALKAEICILPDCGMSPGFGNVLVGHAASKLDRVESVHMLNGGLPEKPVPPLGYVITWSVRDLIDMYSRKVHIVKNGNMIEVDPMTGLEEIDFPGVGKLEAFYTDGLRTLLYTMRNAEDMWEKSLRYPGHTEKIQLLKDLGFFDERQLQIGKLTVSPKELTARLIEDKLKRKNVPDIVAMLIEVSGTENGKRVMYMYHVLDRYDEKLQVTAMGRTTAYTASLAAQLLAKKAVVEKGVVPPEKIGMSEELYNEFMDKMRKRKVIAKESRKTL